jgi:hypothetical protein
MKFTTRHYKDIADVLYAASQRHLPTGPDMLLYIQDRLTRLFDDDNPRFNEDKFNKRCAGED